jgi:hypothetical protein
MSSAKDIDDQAAHRKFSVQCFNQTWDLIDKSDRSPTDDATMLLRSAASLWHWTQRTDCSGRNLSIGYWQLSRVLAITGNGRLASQFARQCLEFAPDDDFFCKAYACEALARAASVDQDSAQTRKHLEQATSFASQIDNQEDRDLVLADLKTIQT